MQPKVHLAPPAMSRPAHRSAVHAAVGSGKATLAASISQIGVLSLIEEHASRQSLCYSTVLRWPLAACRRNAAQQICKLLAL